MSADARRLRRASGLVVALAVLLVLTGCSDDNEGPEVTRDPLPTTAPGDSALLCDMVPRASVAVALGRDPGDLETNNGDVTALTEDPATGHVNGRCRIRSATQSEPALTVVVQWPSPDEQQAVRARVAEGDDYVFPDDFAEGYASGSDSSATAEAIWGDYVVSVVDNEPASGRDPLEDAVALVHQVIDALELSPDVG